MMMRATPQAFLQAIEQMRGALEGIGLPANARRVLDDDIEALTAATAVASKPDSSKIEAHLKSLGDKLKMAGLVMKDITELWEPAKKVAKLAMIPLHLVGLWCGRRTPASACRRG